MFTVRSATAVDLAQLAGLFDRYRQFYRQPADPAAARRYISARFDAADSILLVAANGDGLLLGFCQLYPTWCSVAAARIVVLYDLFVDAAQRRDGVARALLGAAEAAARAAGAVRMELATARDNLAAQRLYESLGWRRDEMFFVYQRALD
jgi:ribosomal protein S18 acetylase RimI-like enzyme